MLTQGQAVRWIGKPLVFVLGLAPLALMAAAVLGGGAALGANPVERLLDEFGTWGLNFLLITLAVTPLQRLTGWRWPIRFRRMLGLFAFTYVSLHFAVYLVLDQSLALDRVLEDVLERPYITIGFAALLMLVPLAVTSTRGMMRRLGRRWQQLHRLIYPIAILGVWHYYWQVKLDALQPLIYATILSALLGIRLWWAWQGARRRRRRRPVVRQVGSPLPAGAATARRTGSGPHRSATGTPRRTGTDLHRSATGTG